MKLLSSTMIISIWRWPPSWKAWGLPAIQSRSTIAGPIDPYASTTPGIAGNQPKFATPIRRVYWLGRELWLSLNFMSIFGSIACCLSLLIDFFFRIRTYPKDSPCMRWVKYSLHLHLIESLRDFLFEEWISVEIFNIYICIFVKHMQNLAFSFKFFFDRW